MDAAGSPVQITLNVLKINGDELMSASFAAHETVAVVKKAVQGATGIPAADQKLLWESQELMNSGMLKDYNLAGSCDVQLVIMNPLARWARVLQDSTGTDFRSKLRRRDAVCKLKEIIAETHVQPDPEAVQCLLSAFNRFLSKSMDYSEVETQDMYLTALTAAAKDTGNADAVDFLMDLCIGSDNRWGYRRMGSGGAVEALCEVVGRSSPTPAVIERLEQLAARGFHRARRFLHEVKRNMQTSSG
eukprot:TRINITY_DN45901_c0_g1_i1.p1 TRINITY_DN45901_c0_g1~~TRINITY_DN45901_c0_g1_i1.p1  ORF type:complete len:245 (-),score=49.48 TRINITY_DN45901_c0_g1_i1:150-884(-)